MSAPSITPTCQQRAAIRLISTGTPVVILARPGSGKTYVVASSIREISRQLKPHQGIAAISFTNKASNELQRRAEGKHLENSYFGTIDSFCIAEIIYPFISHVWGPGNATIVRHAELPEVDGVSWPEVSWLASSQASHRTLLSRQDELKHLYSHGWVLLETVGLLAYHIVECSKACQRYLTTRYRTFFVDEYQDSDAHQHELFRRIQQLGVQCVAVGDPDQSIFSFRGGNPALLTELAASDGFTMLPLEQNHRCHSAIQAYAMAILGRQTEDRPETKRVRHIHLRGSEKQTARYIDNVISECREKYPSVQTFGILTNANHRAELLHSYLQTDSQLLRTSDVEQHHSAWASLFASLLRYRYDDAVLGWDIIGTYSAKTIGRQLRTRLRTSLNQLKMTDSLGDVRQHCIEVAGSICPGEDNEEAIAALDTTLARIDKIGPGSFWGSSEARVSVMTIHKSKGLEFDAIFQADMYEWEFPAKRPSSTADGRPDFDNPVYPNFNEDRRKHYVAVTRGRTFVFLLSSTRRTGSNGSEKSASQSEFLAIAGLSELRL